MTKELDAIMARAKRNLIRTDAEVDAWENKINVIHKETDLIDRACAAVKKNIAKESGDIAPEQMVFSFLPYSIARTSPFFPLNRRDMKDRQYEVLTWENSWGQMTLKGEKLSIYDETVLLSCLSLMRKHKSETFETTRYELCKEMGVSPARDTYHAVWAGLERLTGARISLKVWKPGTKKKKTSRRMVNTILAGTMEDEETDRISITINPYFLRMYAENLVTAIDMKFRANLKGDIAKALYRFFRSQSGMTYECHLLTLCKAINLDVTMETFRLRARIKKGFAELKKAGYLKRSTLLKSDVVKVWKSPQKELLNN